MNESTQLSKEIAGGAERLSISAVAKRLGARFETILRWVIAGRKVADETVRLEALPWGRNGYVTTAAALERFLSRIQLNQDQHETAAPARSPSQARRDVDAAMKRLGV